VEGPSARTEEFHFGGRFLAVDRDGFRAVVDAIYEFVKWVGNGVRCVGNGAFCVAVAAGLAVVNGFVTVKAGLRAFGLQEIEHLHEGVVADRAFFLYGFGIQLVTDVANGLYALLPHVSVPLFDGSVDLLLRHFPHRYHVDQEGEQRLAGLAFTGEVAQLKVTVGVDEAGNQDAVVFPGRGRGFGVVVGGRVEDLHYASVIVQADDTIFNGR